ncbi:protein SOGA3a [Lampris incognitus]|uniref:protein SOGA3a n=1 Tax=Lampris incognitus TaxID=2546036 RepID=UPI0024B4CFB4|nr:protein SOGA3a [Lampris incognitus]
MLGGGGGGYVPSQGWEFVPCPRLERPERGRGNKSCSPLRRISSPPAVLGHILEPQNGGAPLGGVAAQLEVSRGQIRNLQIRAGQQQQQQEQQQQQQQQQLQQYGQTQHSRLKKKFEELKKRHGQDKEEWMHEKESLLREVADIQGGENRRILLDLKSVLEEVQAEVKREEEKRSELQLQYTRDKCAWELEKAELKCRIAQLEAREGAGSVSEGVQSAAGPGGSAAFWNALEARGKTSTFRREREEQRRLLADTHSTAMDLRCRLEHSEKDWSRERAELLERFDVERREWESQLRDMQKKIEELYCEVRAKREGTGLETGADGGMQDNDDVVLRLSLHSTSTSSSLLSDKSHFEPHSSSSQSETPQNLSFHLHNNSIRGDGRDSHHSPCFLESTHCEPMLCGHFAQNDHAGFEQDKEPRGRETQQHTSLIDNKETMDMAELEVIWHGAADCELPLRITDTSKGNERNIHVGPEVNPLKTELRYNSDKKKNSIALTTALKEIARVSEELCSYQDEVRKKTGDKRNLSGSAHIPDVKEALLDSVKTKLEADEPPCDLNQIYNDLRALERENWITLSTDNTWRADSKRPKSQTNYDGTDIDRVNDTNLKIITEMDPQAPAIPPRTTSWNLSSQTALEPILHIPESPVTTSRKCHSPCTLVDRKCNSPSVVRKFEAMLQENEGKVLSDGVMTSCSTPANSNCNVGCCHNRWSCDASKFTNSKLSTYIPFQKSFSEVNIPTAGKDLCPNRHAVGNLKSTEGNQREVPVDLLLPSWEMPPACSNLQGPKRNIMLEQKTAEFNRTLFHAEMGRGLEEDSFISSDSSSKGYPPVCSRAFTSDEVRPPREANFDPQPKYAEDNVTSDIISSCHEVTPTPSTSDPPPQNPEVRARRTAHDSQCQKVKVQHEASSDLSTQQSEVRLREVNMATSETPMHYSEVKHKAQTPDSPSRQTQHNVASETIFSEYILSANTQPSKNIFGTGPKKEKSHGLIFPPAKAGGPFQQPFAETRPRLPTQPGNQVNLGHTAVTSAQPDVPRAGPRVMNDHPWKPLTLAAYPRPEGSRSNYGAVERILKIYEGAALAKQNQWQENQVVSTPNLSPKLEDKVIELFEMQDMDTLPLAPTPRHTNSSYSSNTHMTNTLLSTTGLKETQLTGQESKRSSISLSVQRSFSRPARPAKRRLPSRWSSRSPSSSSSTSTSPSTTSVSPSIPLQKHTSSFTYSHAFHIETVII